MLFTPPEHFGTDLNLEAADEGGAIDVASASAWDVAIRYHDFKSKPSMQRLVQHMRAISAEAIIQKARQVLGSVVHPEQPGVAPLDQLPLGAEAVEMDLDETLESHPLLARGMPPGRTELWVEYRTRRRQPVILVVDTSLSMTGEKLALTAVALAVVLLQFPDHPIGIVAFENRATVLKGPMEPLSVQGLVERFLDVPAQGYTHLESGILEGLRLAGALEGRAAGRHPATVLLTDGKYTAGRDPSYLAHRFKHLHVMKMGSERASLPLCRELARKGGGTLREVPELEALPAAMYGMVKDLLRGKN